jgi:hypothetical protein
MSIEYDKINNLIDEKTVENAHLQEAIVKLQK